MIRLEPRQQKILDKLLSGQDPVLCGNHTTMSRLMTMLLKEIDLPWQTCVALCYEAKTQPQEAELEDCIECSKPVPHDPLDEFLAAKDRELAELEFERVYLTARLPKAKEAGA